MKIRIMLFTVVIIVLGISLAQQKSDEFPSLKGPYLGQKPPGMTPEIFAPGIVSIEIMNHSSPVFSPDVENTTFIGSWRKSSKN